MTTLRTAILALCLLLVPVAALADFTWEIEKTGTVGEFLAIAQFHTFVTNNSAVPDTVQVNMVKDVPGNWVASLCEELLCYPPFLLDIELILAPGQTTELIMDITPILDVGTGSVDITLTSKNTPSETEAATFTVISTEHDVLYISGADGLANDNRYLDAVTATGRNVAVWEPGSLGKTTAADLANFETVIWSHGGFLDTFDATDRANVAAYVAAGGHLMMSGQNLAFGYLDPISPFYDAAAPAWFATTLGAAYVANVGSTDFVLSSAADPVFQGVPYIINGGDGSNDNNSPDVLLATSGGSGDLTYSTGGSAAVLKVHPAGRTAYLGFGFEGLASAAERSQFMSRIFEWFAGNTLSVGDDLVPVLTRRPAAWPNPFNPQTAIHFSVGGSVNLPAQVTVYDVSGRAVRRLFAGEVPPGPQSLAWDGRDDRGRSLGTGVYLARVQVADDHEIVKMTLVK